MSQFVGNAQPQFILGRNDVTVQTVRLSEESYLRGYIFGFKTPWWPRGNNFLGDESVDLALFDNLSWGEYEIVGGTSSSFAIIGITRDQFGSPVGSCTVQLFRTSDDLYIAETTSDSLGNFYINTYYGAVGHYLVAYKAGSPDIFGTTVNTIVGI